MAVRYWFPDATWKSTALPHAGMHDYFTLSLSLSFSLIPNEEKQGDCKPEFDALR